MIDAAQICSFIVIVNGRRQMGNGLKWNGKSQRNEGAHELGGFTM